MMGWIGRPAGHYGHRNNVVAGGMARIELRDAGT